MAKSGSLKGWPLLGTGHGKSGSLKAWPLLGTGHGKRGALKGHLSLKTQRETLGF